MSTHNIPSSFHQFQLPLSRIARCQSPASVVLSYQPFSTSALCSTRYLIRERHPPLSPYRPQRTMGFQPFFTQAKAYLPWSLASVTETNSRSSRSSSIAAAARDRSGSTVSTVQIPAKYEVISTTTGDYDNSLSLEARKSRRTYGLVPPAVESYETQIDRCLKILELKSSSIEKYNYLSHLRSTNVHLFYRLLVNSVKVITPLIYTPTVGEACLRWSELFTQPEGLYISYKDRGHIFDVLSNWPQKVDITVVTDGSRILGLGDLGINGMGIPVGKLALYTACAGINPHATLPLTLDLGTNNAKLREDPLYLGSRREKVSPKEEIEFLDELMEALTRRWPGIVIQFEDFKNPFPALERYRNKYTCFNDDVQGTGAVVLAGIMNAIKLSGKPSKEHRAVFLGAGSAGVGVAKQIVELFIKEGLSEEEAKRRFWFVDSSGLVTLDRGDKLAEHKVYFARTDNAGRQIKSLSELIDVVQPTILMGLSTIGGAFTPAILQQMARINQRPIIFPLSNPSSKSECSLADAVQHTEGRCLFASGSPFPTSYYTPSSSSSSSFSFDNNNNSSNNNENKTITFPPQQGNNMYVFPAIGLASVLAHTSTITQSMIYAAAASLADSLTDAERNNPRTASVLYPDLGRIRAVSVTVARGVIRAAQMEGVDRNAVLKGMSDAQLEAVIKECMYDPFAS